MQNILFFLPTEVAILVPVILGLCIMFKIIPVGAALGFLGIYLIFLAAFPFIEALMDLLPLGILIIIMIAFIMVVARWVLSSLLGKEGAGYVMGHTFMRLLSVPFRILGWTFRSLWGRRN